jgi:hypothetical protein
VSSSLPQCGHAAIEIILQIACSGFSGCIEAAIQTRLL